MSYHAVLCHVMLCHVMSCHVICAMSTVPSTYHNTINRYLGYFLGICSRVNARFRSWLSAITQQVITWVIVDQHLFRCMASLEPKELIISAGQYWNDQQPKWRENKRVLLVNIVAIDEPAPLNKDICAQSDHYCRVPYICKTAVWRIMNDFHLWMHRFIYEYVKTQLFYKTISVHRGSFSVWKL